MTVKVLYGNCCDILPSFRQKKIEFDLIFCDPPFNINQKYQDYSDSMSEAEYMEFTMNWVTSCWRLCRGILVLHFPPKFSRLFTSATEPFWEHQIASVVWHYRFGQCRREAWIDSYCNCWIFARDPKNHTWNPDDVEVDSDRVRYKDKRVNLTAQGGKRVPGTVWGVNGEGYDWILPPELQEGYQAIPPDGPNWGRVQGNNHERRPGHPNQLPEVYMARLIYAYTNPGDRVLDPFGGSGTTATVANTLRRHAVTIDISQANCHSIKERIKKGAVRVSQVHPALSNK